MRIAYASLDAFKAKAKLFESLLKLKGRRRSLELFAQVSGYSNYHEVVHSDTSHGQTPTMDHVAEQLHAHVPQKSADELRRIAGALNLHATTGAGDENKKADAKKIFDSLYVAKNPIGKKSLLQFELANSSRIASGQPLFDPSEQARALQKFRIPQYLLRSHTQAPAHPDRPKFCIFNPGFKPGEMPDNPDLSDWWFAHITEAVYPKYAKKQAQKTISDEEEYVLANFWRDPSQDVANSHPILKTIPRVVELAKPWKSDYMAAYASASIKRSLGYSILVGQIPFPKGITPAGAGAQISCSIAFAETDMDGLRPGNYFSMWEFSACFTKTIPGAGRATPIALMSGTHIVPFSRHSGEFRGVSRRYFMEMLGGHSRLLSQVWTMLKYEYFEDKGYHGVDHFAHENIGDSLTLASLEIVPELRGKGLAPLLLNLFIDTVKRYPATELDADWARKCGLPEAKDKDAEPTQFEFGTPGVMILPVEGAAPSTSPRHPLNESSQSTSKTQNDVEAALRKKKLTKHFRAMKSCVEADVVVFDPLEYQ